MSLACGKKSQKSGWQRGPCARGWPYPTPGWREQTLSPSSQRHRISLWNSQRAAGGTHPSCPRLGNWGFLIRAQVPGGDLSRVFISGSPAQWDLGLGQGGIPPGSHVGRGGVGGCLPRPPRAPSPTPSCQLLWCKGRAAGSASLPRGSVSRWAAAGPVGAVFLFSGTIIWSRRPCSEGGVGGCVCAERSDVCVRVLAGWPAAAGLSMPGCVSVCPAHGWARG